MFVVCVRPNNTVYSGERVSLDYDDGVDDGIAAVVSVVSAATAAATTGTTATHCGESLRFVAGVPFVMGTKTTPTTTTPLSLLLPSPLPLFFYGTRRYEPSENVWQTRLDSGLSLSFCEQPKNSQRRRRRWNGTPSARYTTTNSYRLYAFYITYTGFSPFLRKKGGRFAELMYVEWPGREISNGRSFVLCVATFTFRGNVSTYKIIHTYCMYS